MTFWQRICWIAASLALMAGMVFGLQPQNWVELRFGVDPDGGTGFLEFLLAAIPIGLGLASAIRLLWRLRSSFFTRRAAGPGCPLP